MVEGAHLDNKVPGTVAFFDSRYSGSAMLPIPRLAALATAVPAYALDQDDWSGYAALTKTLGDRVQTWRGMTRVQAGIVWKNRA